MICNPIGRPPESSPIGTEIPGAPARLEGIVQTSTRYIDNGSSVRDPNSKAVIGLVGEMSTSTPS